MKGRKPDAILPGTGTVTRVTAPPAWLSRDARAEWRRVLPALVERQTLTHADLASFENYCEAVGTVREMARTIKAEGHIVETARGPRAHPAVRIQSDAMTRARLLAAELGLTPVSRSRPSIQQNADDELSPLGL